MATDLEVLQSFLAKWPIERLRTMALSDYSGLGADDSYCWWLEHSAAQLGGIGGGSAFKFGVFRRRSREKRISNLQYDEDGIYAWVRKYGDSAQSVFETIRSGLIAIAEASRNGHIAAIENVDIPSAIKWKTAFLYQNQSLPILIPIYAAQALKYLAFGDADARRTISEAYQTLTKTKNDATDVFQFGRNEWARWTAFQGSVTGLIASDGNEWKDAVKATLEHSKRAVIWWSKRPSGKALVANRLKRLVAEKGSFPFYFTRSGKVTHRARVIDIAFESDYGEKSSLWSDAAEYHPDFEDYTDDSRSAAVVFLIDEMSLLDGSLSPSDFSYWAGYSAPTQDNLQPFVSVSASDEEPEEVPAADSMVLMPSKNVIYWGPPGTGKTYLLRKVLFERFTKVSAGKSRAQWLVEEAEAMSWWKIIAAALLAAGPSTVPQISEHEFIRAKISVTNQASPRAMIWSMLQQHTVDDCQYVKYTKRVDPLLFRKDAGSVWSVEEDALKDFTPEVIEFAQKATSYADTARVQQRNYEFITFHQSMTYEDFIEGIKPAVTDDIDAQGISYRVKDGIFKQICQRARLDPGSNYALFIDEINRGNVAGIFGELISLIEEDKREGAENELRAILPYSRESFSVPRNLHVIGTMNSADRSVEALDTALRRRFTFVEMQPEPDKLREVEGVDLTKLLETVNRRLEIVRDRDHRIGHAYLMGLQSLASLQAAFVDKIIPLLQEYFYGDWSKIAMVLGSRFVVRNDAKVTWPKGFEDDGEAGLVDAWMITLPPGWDADAFRSIYA